MSALLGTFVRMQTMADGSVRVVLDLQCSLSDFAALNLSPGSPLGIARITNEASMQAEKPKGGKNSQWVAMRCNEPEFREFLAAKFYGGKPITTKEEAAEEVRFICSVDSRAELDSDPIAENRFHELIRIPYSKYINER